MTTFVHGSQNPNGGSTTNQTGIFDGGASIAVNPNTTGQMSMFGNTPNQSGMFGMFGNNMMKDQTNLLNVSGLGQQAFNSLPALNMLNPTLNTVAGQGGAGTSGMFGMFGDNMMNQVDTNVNTLGQDAFNKPEVEAPGFSVMDGANIGMSAIGMGLGYHMFDKKMDVMEGKLDLSRQQYNDYRQDRKDITDANKQRNANADAKRAKLGLS